MHDCIYTPYCTYKQCDLACPNRAEVNCWFKRCRLDMSNNCLHTNIRNIEKAEDLLSNKYGETVWFPTDNPSDATLFATQLFANMVKVPLLETEYTIWILQNLQI